MLDRSSVFIRRDGGCGAGPQQKPEKKHFEKGMESKMENKFKRFLSLLLAFTMVLSYVPVQSFADEPTLCEHSIEASTCEICAADPDPLNEEDETPENPVTPDIWLTGR